LRNEQHFNFRPAFSTLCLMEFMNLTVQKVERLVDTPLWAGMATAHSVEQIEGLPVATLRLQVRFQLGDGESLTDRALRERARDEALRFLDIA
jgi:hypothetical protein